MNIVISGASGLIGRRLLASLARDHHTLHVLSRGYRVSLPPGVGLSVWNPDSDEPPAASLRGADAMIHLAGENVAQRWTPEAKRRIRRKPHGRHAAAGSGASRAARQARPR